MTSPLKKSGPVTSSATFLARVVSGVVLVNLFVLVLAGLSLRQSYLQFQQGAEITTRNLAQALENDIAGTIRADDVALFTMMNEYQRQRAGGGVDAAKLNAFIERLREHLPQIDALRIADEQGRLIYGTGIAPGANLSVADRPHFIRLRNDPEAGLVFSDPQISRVNQKWRLALVRRIDERNGSFDGMAIAAIELEQFSRTFSGLNVGAHGIVTLRDDRLGIVVHHPEPEKTGSVVGQKTAPAPLRKMVQAGEKSGTYKAYSTVDGIERTFSYRRVGNYPLLIIVGLASDDYLAEWRSVAIRLATLVLLFALSTVAAATLVYRNWKRQAGSVAALAEQEAKFRTVADFTYDWEYWQGPQREILYMTPSCERVTGYSSAEFIADPGLLMRIIHPDDLPRMKSHMDQIASCEDGALVDFRIVRRDGAIRSIAHHCRAVSGRNGEAMGRRVSNRDVTESTQSEAALREKTEALLRSNADLEQFAYSISHDMRQPLRMVTGHLQLLERALNDRLDDNDRENLAFALDGARRMDAMIVSLLDYSRIGRKTSSRQWMASRDSLDEALAFLAPAIAESSASISVSGEWPRIFASRDELTRLFQNLVGNAVKYHAADQAPRIEVASAVTPQLWRVSVRDHGIGIATQQIDRLFQFFSRLQSRVRFEGTGMGLALCRRITEHHGGRIWVESAGEGLGSTFIFELPLLPADIPAGDGETEGEQHESR